jgi:branched-chain amino acid transport system permease protein
MTWFVKRVGLGFIAAILATAVASRFDTYPLFLIGQTAILSMITAALVLLIGVAGLVSIASAATAGVGAYVALILVVKAGFPFMVAVASATAIGTLLSAFLGLVAIRLGGLQLAIVTLGALQVFQALIKNGGALVSDGYGVFAPTISMPVIGNLNQRAMAMVSVAVASFALVAVKTLIDSHTGRVWTAMKDNEAAAQMQGINVGREKVLAFAASSAVIALAGSLYGFLLGAATPPSFTVTVSVEHIALAVVAGMSRRILGAIIAPVLLFLVPSWFDGLNEYHDVLYAGLMLVSLMLLPGGLSELGVWAKSSLAKLTRKGSAS